MTGEGGKGKSTNGQDHLEKNAAEKRMISTNMGSLKGVVAVEESS